jgi:hypothetical protein
LGLGLFAMGFSSITVQMLAAGFTAVEMLGWKHGGWGHRLCMLLPVPVGAPIGIWVAVSGAPLPFAIYVSVGMVFFLPITYLGFMILNNMASYLGDAMPRGRRRWLWNIGLALAIAVVTVASFRTAYNKWKSYQANKAKQAKETSWLVPAPDAKAAQRAFANREAP